MDNDLLEEDLVKFAAKHYYSPKGRIDPEEFYDDLKRFRYIKRLVNRYLETGNLSERLILNLLIVIFNVLGNYAALRIMGMKLEDEHWKVIKPFLKYLSYIRSDQLKNVKPDPEVTKRLKRI